VDALQFENRKLPPFTRVEKRCVVKMTNNILSSSSSRRGDRKFVILTTCHCDECIHHFDHPIPDEPRFGMFDISKFVNMMCGAKPSSGWGSQVYLSQRMREIHHHLHGIRLHKRGLYQSTIHLSTYCTFFCIKSLHCICFLQLRYSLLCEKCRRCRRFADQHPRNDQITKRD
jgi:hypothetical protein